MNDYWETAGFFVTLPIDTNDLLYDEYSETVAYMVLHPLGIGYLDDLLHGSYFDL